MKQVIKNLQYIQRSIDNNTYKEQSAIIHLLLTETIGEVKQLKFFYDAPYTSENYLKHHFTYIQLAKKEKAKVLSDLNELQDEFSKSNVNKNRVIKIVTTLLETRLGKQKIEGIMNRWQSKSHREVRTARIFAD
ncbi:hypothetical protein ACIQ2D_21420 [Lysinibacillus sp. NPDC097287]|uniref:hypothetical protein n=1 Tax=Lysinibacillus sp. NPDC097287 TaxID=3364144 RepID=UPI003813F3C0